MSASNFLKFAGRSMRVTGGVNLKTFCKNAEIFTDDKNIGLQCSSGVHYDSEPAEEIINANLVAYFGPDQQWIGDNYGFDWYREPNVNTYTDGKPFAGTIGKYYQADHTTLVFTGDYEKNYFFLPNNAQDQDQGDLRLLKSEYNEILMDDVAKSPYYVPWLSLMKDRIAALNIDIRVVTTADYLQFDTNECFNFEPERIDPPFNLAQSVKIACLKTFATTQKIFLRSYKKGINNDIQTTLVGKINVWPNYRVIHKKIVMINVKIEGSKSYKFSEEKETLEHILGQVYIVPQVDEHMLDLSQDQDFKTKFLTTVPTVGGGIQTMLINPELLSQPLPPPSLSEVMKEKMSAYPQYRDYLQVFMFDIGVEQSPDWVEKGIYDKMTDIIMVYYNFGYYTVSHEVLHALGLRHTFANAEHSKYQVRFTYEYRTTDNIMDYSKFTYTTFHWQWEVVHYMDAVGKVKAKLAGANNP